MSKQSQSASSSSSRNGHPNEADSLRRRTKTPGEAVAQAPIQRYRPLMLGNNDDEKTAWLMVAIVVTLTIAAFFAISLLISSVQ